MSTVDYDEFDDYDDVAGKLEEGRPRRKRKKGTRRGGKLKKGTRRKKTAASMRQK